MLINVIRINDIAVLRVIISIYFFVKQKSLLEIINSNTLASIQC